MVRNEKKILEFFSKEKSLDMLKVIDGLNPVYLSVSKLCTIKDVSVAMGMELRDVWNMIDEGHKAGLFTYYGGVLSKRRVDITDLGEYFLECRTQKDIKEALKRVED